MKRRFLFLQGVISPLFARLSDQLRHDGHDVFRINFCAGDALIWGARPSWQYRGGLAALADYFNAKFRRHGFTDLVLFGDQRPIHMPAIEIANARGVRVLVFEEGYVRPNWITLERGGVNARSALPREAGWYRAVDRWLPRYGDGQSAPSRLGARACYDIAYHLANASNPLFFPDYRTHRPHSAVQEYIGWVRRFTRFPLRRRRDARLIRTLLDTRKRFFLLPLQLNSDAQIRRHSRFDGMPAVIETVLRSFAGSAPGDTHLVVKNHPLDTGMINYGRLIERMGRDLDLAGRLHFVETGHLPTLLDHALGLVTVNSTTGMSALVHHCPTLVLGEAIYDLPGLTHRGGLDSFWAGPEPPDQHLCDAFRNAVIHATQVNGSFYDSEGMQLVLRGTRRLMGVRSPLDDLPACGALAG